MSQTLSNMELNKPVPYTLHLDDDLLSATKKKIDLARYPEEQIDIGEDIWSQGSKVSVVKRLAEYWRNGYDWRAEEVRVQTNLRAGMACQELHSPCGR